MFENIKTKKPLSSFRVPETSISRLAKIGFERGKEEWASTQGIIDLALVPKLDSLGPKQDPEFINSKYDLEVKATEPMTEPKAQYLEKINQDSRLRQEYIDNAPHTLAGQTVSFIGSIGGVASDPTELFLAMVGGQLISKGMKVGLFGRAAAKSVAAQAASKAATEMIKTTAQAVSKTVAGTAARTVAEEAVVSATKAAEMASRVATKLSPKLLKSSTKLGIAVAEASVQNAASEAIVYNAEQSRLSEYTLRDSMMNMAIGSTVFVGGAHALREVGAKIGIHMANLISMDKVGNVDTVINRVKADMVISPEHLEIINKHLGENFIDDTDNLASLINKLKNTTEISEETVSQLKRDLIDSGFDERKFQYFKDDGTIPLTAEDKAKMEVELNERKSDDFHDEESTKAMEEVRNNPFEEPVTEREAIVNKGIEDYKERVKVAKDKKVELNEPKLEEAVEGLKTQDLIDTVIKCLGGLV